MAIPTRAFAESEFVRFWGRHMAVVGMDISEAGANQDLNMPMRDALQAIPITMSDPTIVKDVDLAGLYGSQYTRFSILAQFRIVELIESRWPFAMLATQLNLNVTPEQRQKVLELMLADLLRRKKDLLAEIKEPLRSPPSSTPGILGQTQSGGQLNAQGNPNSCPYVFPFPYLY